jgi:hypothetical protein
MKVRIIFITTVVVFTLLAACKRKNDESSNGNTMSRTENTAATCSDGIDNNNNGEKDCDEQNCKKTSVCQKETGDSSTYGGAKDSGSKNDNSNGDASSNSNSQIDAAGPVCEEQGISIKPKEATVMLLIDYSSSMATNPPDPPHRWAQAVTALTTVLQSVNNPYISFGLDYFPDGSDPRIANGMSGECGVKNPVQIDCAANNQQNIVTFLANKGEPPAAGNMTPMWCAANNFNTASYAPGCAAANADRYLVIVSDGSDTCGVDCHCMDTPDTCGLPDYGATASDLGSLSANLCSNSVKTFVISFGGGADYEKLNAMASNGCTAMTSFLDAADGNELLDAFDKIINAIVACDYDIEQPDERKADPEKINFKFDNTTVRRNDEDCESSDGWQWTDSDHTKIQFCKQSCDQLKSGSVTEVKATFGCPTLKNGEERPSAIDN